MDGTPRVRLEVAKSTLKSRPKVETADPIYAALTDLILTYQGSGKRPVFSAQSGGDRFLVKSASLSAPVPGVRDNCLQYQMTTRDGYTLFLREWLKPNDGTSAILRKQPNTTQSLLMLAGYPHSAMHTFNYQVNDKILSTYYRMVTMEIRGFGDSSKPTSSADFTPQKLADDIQDAISLLQMQKVTLVAHSSSGTVATRYLDVYGQSSLAGLVLTSAVTKLDLSNPAVGAATLDPFIAAILPSSLNLNNDLGDYYRGNHTACINLSFTSPLVDPNYKADELAMDMLVPPATRQAFFFPPVSASNAVLSTITIPAMVLHAQDDCGTSTTCTAKDKLVKFSHALENYNLLKTSSRKVSFKIIDGVGNMLQAEAPTLFNGYLVQFLRSL